MTILNKITKALNVFYNIPSLMVLVFFLVHKAYQEYKKNGNADDVIHNKSYLHHAVEDFKPIGKHINIAFWILVVYFMYF